MLSAIVGGAIALALAVAPPAFATSHLVLRAEVSFADRPTVALTATSDGDEPARQIRPEAVFQHATVSGSETDLEPGGAHTWRLDLVAPDSPGTYPVTARVRYVDGSGREHVEPLVALVRTPAAPPSSITLGLEAGVVRRTGTAHLRIANRGDHAVAGRVVAVLPDALHTDPESQPVRLAAGGELVLPFVLRNRRAAAGDRLPAYAYAEHSEDGTNYVALAETHITIEPDTERTPVPLVVGAVFTGAAIAIVVFALRRTRA